MADGQTRLDGEIGCVHGVERGRVCVPCGHEDAPTPPVEQPFGQHSKRHRRADMECVRCGRSTPDPKWWAHVIDGGARYVTGGEQNKPIEKSGDMGWFPVGSECRKILTKAGVILELIPDLSTRITRIRAQ